MFTLHYVSNSLNPGDIKPIIPTPLIPRQPFQKKIQEEKTEKTETPEIQQLANELAEADQRATVLKQLLSDKRAEELSERAYEKNGFSVPYKTLMKMTTDFKPGGLSLALQNMMLTIMDEDPQKAKKLSHRHWDIMTGVKIPSNQQFSGRCWMFAGLNILARQLITVYNLSPDFELSQSYLFFWHYVEQYNDLLNLFWYKKELKDPFNEERKLLLDKPLHDGGNWINFSRLIKKYGIVPKDMYSESFATKRSAEMQQTLSTMVASDILKLETLQFDTDKDFNTFRDTRIKKVVDILCSFMGKPPSEGMIKVETAPPLPTVKLSVKSPLILFHDINTTAREITDANNTSIIISKFDIDNQIQLIHDLREDNRDIDDTLKLSKDQTWYTTTHQERQEEKNLLFNIKDMNTLVDIVLVSLRMRRPVWFACNMNNDVDRRQQGMDEKLFRPDLFMPEGYELKMSKKDRMNYGTAACNHAMLIVGAETEPAVGMQPQVLAFNVENSWGKEGPGQGFYKMSREWFVERAYTVVVDRSIIEAVLGQKIGNGQDLASAFYPSTDFFG